MGLVDLLIMHTAGPLPNCTAEPTGGGESTFCGQVVLQHFFRV